MNDERAESQQRLLSGSQDRVRVPLGLVVRSEENYFLRLDLPRDEVQQLQRRRVRPLQVLQDDEERLLGGEASQKLREAPEQSSLELGRVGAGGGTVPFGRCTETWKEVREVRCATTRQHRHGCRIQLAD